MRNLPKVSRNLAPRVAEALTDTRVVVVQGARQVGKSTLAQGIVDTHGGKLVTLDDETMRAAAGTDPTGFVRQLPNGLLSIDEVQRVPSLIPALKSAVDSDPRPGRFLLTGSADLLRMPATEESLAGRAESLELFGFSQGELDGVEETFVDRLLDGDLFLGHRSNLSRQEYLERACAGSYPEALARPAGRRRAAWFDNYITRLLQRDAVDVSGLQRLADLPHLLKLLAARNTTELNQSALASATGIPVRTLPPYLGLLETLFLIERVPSWSTNLSKRVVERPKVHFLDSGLAARLINFKPAETSAHPSYAAAGQLLEGFVLGELRRQLGWSEQTPAVHHFRSHDGAEVDLVLETDDGRVAALEVKAASAVQGRDARWLNQLRDKLGSRFVGGLILHTGVESAPFGDRLAAVPLDVLWSS